MEDQLRSTSQNGALTLRKIRRLIDGEIICGEDRADQVVDSASGSDLMSDVLARARAGTLWAANQKHQNVIGVAVMLSLAGVVIAGGVEPDENTLHKAADERTALYTTDATMFEVVGRLYELGVRSC